MISEQEVLESLDRLGEKLQQLRDENNQQKSKIEELENANKFLAANNIDSTRDADEYYEKWQGAVSSIEGEYEPLIEKLKQENKTLGERCIQLTKDKGDLVDKVQVLKADIERLKASADAKDRSLEAINNRLKSFFKISPILCPCNKSS